jgi:hypothetical protein
MPKKEAVLKGTPQEQKTYWEVKRHYDMSREDLDVRMSDWNKKDELFRSHINEEGWPYSAMVFDPRVFTAIFEKSARLLANKPKGRMVPREGGDALGAKINNALLDFQWDDSERVDGEPMLSKWARMDMNARKYGASFALIKWHSEKTKKGDTKFDGPSFKPWNNRDVLHNPSYSSIQKWIQLREWVTLDEMLRVNDTSRKKPFYKNLDIIRDSLRDEARGGGDMRSTAWASKNLSIKGLQDFRGKDEVFKTFEFITEYRDDKWISFAPKYGVILREIENPYLHGRIPVTQLKYYPIDEDIYGLSEIEPIEKLQKALNALVCQYLDAINMGLYTPIKVRTASVQMHTLEFGPGKKWLMNDPQSDVVPYETSSAGVAEFASTYRFLVGAMQEALGETSAAVSQLVPGEGERTATEIRELSLQRNVRDNYNQLFLSEAIKDQMMLWHSMNQQFFFDGSDDSKVIRIVGRDAVTFFEEAGLSEQGIDDETMETLTSPEMEEVISDPGFDMNEVMKPLFPVSTPEGNIPKMVIEDGGEVGHLVMEPGDISGYYDYIPDVRSMSNPEPAMSQALAQLINQAKDPAAIQARAADGVRLKISELEKDFFELSGLKNADKYFEPVSPEEANAESQINGIGEGAFGAGASAGGPNGVQGVPGGAEALAGGAQG